MTQKTIIRGDTYSLARPLARYELKNDDGSPLNLSGYTIMTTYKAAKTPIASDPFDNGNVKHHMIVSNVGAITSSIGLRLESNAAAGVILEGMTSAETASLPVDKTIYNDIQLIDPNGETTTFIMTDTIIAIDAYTNRSAVA